MAMLYIYSMLYNYESEFRIVSRSLTQDGGGGFCLRPFLAGAVALRARLSLKVDSFFTVFPLALTWD